jgi:hypothetical protein
MASLVEQSSQPPEDGNQSNVQSKIQSESGHRFGNFPNYYSFHGVDERMECISDEFLVNCFGLNHLETGGADKTMRFTYCDIGCNDGTFTKKLHDRIDILIASIVGDVKYELHTIGLELDQSLVERARSNNSDISSKKNIHSSIQYETVNVADALQFSSAVNNFFKNKNGEEDILGSFNLLTCFSTTMWVHLNSGDVQFQSFLKQTARYSNNIIIEPQPWKCYRNVIAYVYIYIFMYPLFSPCCCRYHVSLYLHNFFFL